MAAPARVSVLLITKNGERYLAETLRCIRAQQGRFHLAEIIAVDSGSRDRTLAILESHAVRVIRIPPQEFRPRQDPQPGRGARRGATIWYS